MGYNTNQEGQWGLTMYLRTREQALDAMADILELRDRRDQLVESTVKIMLCLEPDTRTLLVDCQDFLVLGGLEGIRRRRRELLKSSPVAPRISFDSDEGRYFEAIGAALDALRFANAVRGIFPELRHERWQLARVILADEAGVRQAVEEALRSRGDVDIRTRCAESLREKVLSMQQSWMDRAGAIRSACLQAVRDGDPADSEGAHEEADLLFDLFATSDGRAMQLLDAVDRVPADALRQVGRLRETAQAIRALGAEPPTPPMGDAGKAEVA